MNRGVLRVYSIVELGHSRRAELYEIESRIGAVLRGGATVVQLREKGDRFEAVARVVRAVRPWLRAAGVPLIINDRPDFALDLGADGVHLGQRDLPVAEARRRAAAHGRSDFWVGVSVTTPEQARDAVLQGAAYLSASPVFGTTTKADIDPPIGTAGIRKLRTAAGSVPLIAIGGIRPHNVSEVLAASADGVAFVWPHHRDPQAGVREMKEAVSRAKRSSTRQAVA